MSLIAYFADFKLYMTEWRFPLSFMLLAWAISLESRERYSCMFLPGNKHIVIALPSIVAFYKDSIRFRRYMSLSSCYEIILLLKLENN